MAEHLGVQRPRVNLYRTDDRLMVAAPLPGMEPSDIVVEITATGQLVLHGEFRGALTGQKRRTPGGVERRPVSPRVHPASRRRRRARQM